MKNYFKLVFFLVLLSCENEEKHTNCIKDKDGLLNCESFDSQLKYSIDENSKSIVELTNIKYDYKVEFYSSIDKIKVLSLYDYNSLYGIFIQYKEDGTIKKIMREDLKFHDQIYVSFLDDKIVIEVYSRLKDWNISKITSYLTINKSGDTSNYFYYKKDKSGFDILTDLKEFSLENKNLDTLEIAYTDERLDEMKFDNPQPHDYYPVFEDRTKNRIFNNYRIETTQDEIIGTLWGTMKKGTSKSPYVYKLLYFQGDLAARIQDFLNEICTIKKKYYSKTILNSQVLKDLLSTGIYEVKNGQIVKK